MVIQVDQWKTGENYKEAYEIWRGENQIMRINVGVKILSNYF
jgi:hypothetical protein